MEISYQMCSPSTSKTSDKPEPTRPTPIRPCNGHSGTGKACVTSCKGLPKGTYQSCSHCYVFVKCDGKGNMRDNRPCAYGLMWDNNKKQCVRSSSTCSHQCIGKDYAFYEYKMNKVMYKKCIVLKKSRSMCINLVNSSNKK